MTYLDQANITRLDETRYRATLSPTWRSMLDIHGGYIAAIAAHAMERSHGEHQQPLRSYTAQFLRPAHPGDVTINVETVRRGRTTAFVRATIIQDDRPVMTSTAIAGADKDGPSFIDVTPPPGALATPTPGAVQFTGDEPGLHFEQLEFILEPGLELFGSHAQARVAGWLRPLDHADVITSAWIICATDFMPPSMVFRTDQPVQAATIEMTVQLVHSWPATLVPAGGYIYAEASCAISSEGYSVEDATFWATPGAQLLATSRQLRLAGNPPPKHN